MGGSSSGEVKVRWYLMEFASGISVQRNSFTLASASSTQDVTITAVDTSKTFALAYATSTSSTSVSNDEQRLLKAELTSSTNLRFTRNESGSDLHVVWQVVELDGAQVQSGTVSIANGSLQTTCQIDR